MTTNQLVGLGIGLLFSSITGYSFRTGKAMGKGQTFERSDSPVGYWFYITLYGLLGATCVIGAFTFFP